MSLPAGQQRVIDKVESALRDGEPALESMFAIFARLNEGEPVAAEPLQGSRRRRPRPGNSMYAIVLIPVMFAAILAGALLGGSARSAGACEAGYSVGGVSPLANRTSCATPAKAAAAQAVPAKTGEAQAVPAKAAADASAGSVARGTGTASCASLAGPVRPASRLTTTTGGDQVFSPPVRAGTASPAC
jgi:hypothetical protein